VYCFVDSGSDLFFACVQKLEAKNDSATGCGPSESLDDGISDSDSHRSSGEDNVSTELLTNVSGWFLCCYIGVKKHWLVLWKWKSMIFNVHA